MSKYKTRQCLSMNQRQPIFCKMAEKGSAIKQSVSKKVINIIGNG